MKMMKKNSQNKTKNVQTVKCNSAPFSPFSSSSSASTSSSSNNYNSMKNYLSNNPQDCNMWIEYANFEKKKYGLDAATSVLLDGISKNPRSSTLCVSYGLLEIENGNRDIGMWMLYKASILDPSCARILTDLQNQ